MTMTDKHLAETQAAPELDVSRADTLLFDLDGTLLPMDEELFVKLYMHALSQAFADRYDPALMQKTLWESVGLMVGNDLDVTNETRLWELMESRFPGISAHKEDFDAFYRAGFDAAQPACPRREGTGAFLEELKKRGWRLIHSPISRPMKTPQGANPIRHTMKRSWSETTWILQRAS